MINLFNSEAQRNRDKARLVRDLVREAKEEPGLSIEVRDNELDVRIRHDRNVRVNAETGEIK